ncbi:MAG: alpha/beta fold hydrolase, partial [Planctomycetota bacterium]|nr:alpha/beta fold hydrolase [Planctomycetota bacterium]
MAPATELAPASERTSVTESAPGTGGPAAAPSSTGEQVGGAALEPLAGASAARAPVAEEGGGAALAIETKDGLSMAYSLMGEGRPIVLIHGWCGNGAQWAGAATALARSYRVVVVDLVGHGASAGQARAKWSVEAYGDDVARLLESEGLQGAVLVGHSMGGPVALEAAVRASDRVAAIVGVESLHRLAGEADPARMAPYVTRFKDNFPAAMGEFTSALLREESPPEVKARILADSTACEPSMAVALVEYFGTYDPKPAARFIDIPVRCINAQATPTDVEGNRALLSSFDVELFGETGHWPHLEAPRRFEAVLEGLLAELLQAPEPGVEALVQVLAPVIRCEDLAATADFYTERLRFGTVERAPGEAPEAPGTITLSRDGTMVVLQSLAGLREDLPEVSLRPGRAILRLEVSSLSAELAAVGEALRVVVPERRLASGARQVVIEDPAGSLLILRQAREQP